LIIKEDNLYNIIFQIIVGIIALVCTYYFFKNKFPLCRLALWHKFFMFFCLTGSCNKAIHLFTIDTEITVNKLHNDTK
jgi:energy-coupling factor transporter transmembrane protein EcfT